MVCSNWIEDFPSGAPWLFFSSVVFVFCFRPLLRRSCYHSDQRDRSPAGHSLWFDLCWGAGTYYSPHCDELVLLVLFCLFMLFSFPRIVFSSAKFLAHAHDVCFRSPNLSRTLAVHRIGWCFEPVGAVRAEAIPCCSSVGRHQRHKRRWGQHGWAPLTVTVQKDVQVEESLGG